MLSLLIPIYNFDTSELVYELHAQALNANINFEILLVDDFSTELKEKNSKLQNLKHVVYEELTCNFGRSKIRNYLAGKAKYDNLIFLDCDSGIISIDFIEKYIQNVDKKIVYGGRIYAKKKPDANYYFHWYYGVNRESQKIEIRKQNPNKGFQTNNFMIKSEIFNNIKFNETIKGYGHEDTLFGYELKNRKIEITHIDNPVIHLGLEKTDDFLRKTKNGLNNLIVLTNLFPDENGLFEDIKVLDYFFKAKKFYFCGLIKLMYLIFNRLIYWNLKGKNPKLFLFDFYKLGFLCLKF
ncbi:MAG: glycosyltransferase [Bacteroidales bacterium]|nr:glycosyltransferase [Bacteroidales bacterium]